MSEKFNENELDEQKKSYSDSSEKPYVPNEVNYEDNDNWEFEAKALTLEDTVVENDKFEINIPKVEQNYEPKEEKADISVQKSAPKKKEKKEKKEASAPAKARKKSGNRIKFTAAALISAAVIAVLVVLGVRYYTLPNNVEKMNPGNVALSVGDTDVSIGMYNYYYTAVSNNYITYAQQGYISNLDTTVDYAKQNTTDENGKTVTWAELFENEAVERVQYITAYYQEAVKNGVTLTDTQKDQIKTQISSISDAAKEAGKSVDKYISDMYGDYCGSATLKKFLEQYYIANNYMRMRLIENKVSKEEVNAYYEKHKDEYTEISFAYLFIPYDSEKEDSKKETEKKAKKYASEINSIKELKKAIPSACKELIDDYVSAGQFESADDCAEAIAQSVETTITKSDTSLTEAVTKWLFDEKTKVNDCSYFPDETNGLYLVVLKTSEPRIADDEVYSVRHILITPKSESADNEATNEETGDTSYTDEEWAAAEKKANNIFKKYKKGDKTEYSFALLAEEYSDDTESTSNGSSGLYGGLYEGVPLGQMVKGFEDWSTDKSRKYGDTGIVKSDYGYHIMFFVEDTKSYIYNCEMNVASEKEEKFYKSIKVKKHKNALKKAVVAEPETTTQPSTQPTTQLTTASAE